MGYCPRCGENSTLVSTPPSAEQQRRRLRISARSSIVNLPPAVDDDVISYGGMRFRVERSGDELLLWAIE